MTALPPVQIAASPAVLELMTHLWQSTAVAVLILALLFACRGLSARTRRTLGWIGVVKFFVPAAGLAAIAERIIGARTQWLEAEPLALPMQFSPAAIATEPAAAAWIVPAWVWPVMAGIWFCGAAALLVAWNVRGRRLRRRLLAGAVPASAELARAVVGAAGRAGLRAAPRCVVVSSESSPGAVGIFSPLLVLPARVARVLSPRELEAILIHECVHLRRRDNLWGAVRAGFVALFWFNPVAWLLNRAIGLETEKSCDERVLAITGDAETYARSIVACVRHALGLTPAGFSAVTTPPVLARLQAILGDGARRHHPAAHWTVLVAAVALALFSGRAGSIAAEAAPAPTAKSPASNPPPAEAPAFKVGKVLVRFVGTPNATEQFVRETMQLREGSALEEATLNRDMRALYRTGKFEFVEMKYVRADATTMDLVVEVTAKAAGVGVQFEGVRTVDPTSSDPATRPMRALEEALDEGKRRAAEANAELKKLRDERAAALAKLHELEAARATPAGPPRISEDPIRSDAPRAGDTPSADPSELAEAGRKRDLAEVRLRLLRADRDAVDAIRRANEVAAQDRIAVGVVHELKDLDQKPVPKFQARPRYPFEMRRAGITGEAVVEFIIDTEGNVVDARAIRSTREEFEAAAAQAVSKWKFRPGRKGNRDVPTRMQVPIVFTLDER